MTVRLFASMVVRNEASRYLESVLFWHRAMVDGFHVFDDQSDDDTVGLAKAAGTIVTVRDDHTPSFMEHEGLFRQGAWNAFEEALEPRVGDWVLAIDADEFLISPTGLHGTQARRLAEEAMASGADSVRIRIPEVFDVAIDPTSHCFAEPKIRTDGWWGKIVGTRLFAYKPGGVFPAKKMASGSEPTYLTGVYDANERLYLLHFGYALAEDQQAKYRRYSGVSGHGDAHIESILAKPSLQAWWGPTPMVWR